MHWQIFTSSNTFRQPNKILTTVFAQALASARTLAMEFALYSLFLYNYVQGFPQSCDSRGFDYIIFFMQIYPYKLFLRHPKKQNKQNKTKQKRNKTKPRNKQDQSWKSK